MDCIPYIKDLLIEIETLKAIRQDKDDTTEIDRDILKKEQLIKKCKENLSKLSNNSIEYRIYIYYLDGLNINKAISKVADENYRMNIKPSSERAIYKNYYSKIKKYIESSVKVQ